MLSLNSRLLLGASAVLVCFLGLTGLALDRAFRDSAEGALRDRLQGYIYALLAAADLQPDGLLHWPQELPEPGFSQAGSGLYAQIISNDGGQYWQSPSMLGIVLPLPSQLSQGERVFSQVADAEGVPFYRLSFGVTYVGPHNREQHYTFSATESLDSLHDKCSNSAAAYGSGWEAQHWCCSRCRAPSCAGAWHRCVAPSRT